MADASDYLTVTFPYDTKTATGQAVRLFGTDGHRSVGALLDASGAIIGAMAWLGDGYVYPPQAMNPDSTGDAARPTTPDDLIPPPAVRAQLIAAQQAIIDAANARLATATADTPSEWTAVDTAAVAAAEAVIAGLTVG